MILLPRRLRFFERTEYADSIPLQPVSTSKVPPILGTDLLETTYGRSIAMID